jgi:hypothetical protein
MTARFRPPRPGRVRRAGASSPPAQLAAVHVMPRPALRPVRLVVLDCPVCELHAGPFLPVEADQLAGTHDDLMHGGRPTVVVSADPDPQPTFTLADSPPDIPPGGGPTRGGAA